MSALLVRGYLLPQLEDLGILFGLVYERRVEWEVDRWIRTLSAVMQVLYTLYVVYMYTLPTVTKK